MELKCWKVGKNSQLQQNSSFSVVSFVEKKTWTGTGSLNPIQINLCKRAVLESHFKKDLLKQPFLQKFSGISLLSMWKQTKEITINPFITKVKVNCDSENRPLLTKVKSYTLIHYHEVKLLHYFYSFKQMDAHSWADCWSVNTSIVSFWLSIILLLWGFFFNAKMFATY